MKKLFISDHEKNEKIRYTMEFTTKFKKYLRPRSIRIVYLLVLSFSWINIVHTIEYGSAEGLLKWPRSRFRARAQSTTPRFLSATNFTTPSNITLHFATLDSPTRVHLHTKRPKSKLIFNEELKSHIKRVLNFEETNSTLEKYIVNSFNLYNADPLYIFVLPGEINQTLVLRRSNFSEAIFPNVAALHMLRKLSLASHAYAAQHDYDKKLEKLKKNDEIPQVKLDQFLKGVYELDEAASLRIIEENVRTERNFLKFMEDLNKHNEIAAESKQVVSVKTKDGRSLNEYEVLLQDIHAKAEGSNNQLLLTGETMEQIKATKRPQQQNVSWKEMGLDGWVGSLNPLYTFPNGKPLPNGPPFSPLNDPNEHLFELKNKNVPISTTFDSRLYMTTRKPGITLSDLPTFHEKEKIPPHVKSYSYVRVYKQNHIPSSVKPWPVTTPQMTTTPQSVTLFSPADTYLNSGEFYRDNKWEVKMEIPDGLRDLLKVEREKLRNISLSIGFDAKDHKIWPLTSSRAAHRDNDVFIGRANNPFGHSTRWKWNNATDRSSIIEGRQKRGVVELYSMVKCATGCDPLIYKGYGCYCGFLGSGRALDGIDRCCKMHDYCYTHTNCPNYLEYFVPYIWKCYRGRPLCAIDHGEWGGPGSCAATLCQCDQALSKCLRRFYCPRKRAVCTTSPARLLQNLIMDL